MRRLLSGIGVLFAVFVLVACGGDGDAPGDEGPGGDGDDRASDPVDTDELSYLTVTPLGLSRIAAESGEESEVVAWEDLGLAFGETPSLVRVEEGLVWGAIGAGRLVAIDAESGDLERDITFGSTQQISNYGFANGLLWVEAGYEFADAVVLGVDADTGEVMFTTEPPAGGTIGGMAVGEEGVWIIGGNPETAAGFSRVDPTSGLVEETFDAGLVAKYIMVGAGSVWVGGDQYQFEGQSGDAVVRVDPETGAEIARFEVGDSLRAILEYNGAIWVADSAGPEFSGAQVHRIDPETNEITDSIDIGEAGTGSISLLAGDGYLFAVNSGDRLTYVINADTVEGEVVLSGPYGPVGIR